MAIAISHGSIEIAYHGANTKHEYHGPERRSGLSKTNVERIAELAAKKALEKVYSEVGKGVIKKLAWLAGLIVVAGLMWLGKNNIPLK